VFASCCAVNPTSPGFLSSSSRETVADDGAPQTSCMARLAVTMRFCGNRIPCNGYVCEACGDSRKTEPIAAMGAKSSPG
jgi:hypothetical protein